MTKIKLQKPKAMKGLKLIQNFEKKKEYSIESEIFVGIDVHKSKWVVTISHGFVVIQTYSMEANANQLIKKLKKDYLACKIVCAYEAGFSGFWLQRSLEQAGISCLVINAADIPTTNKERRRKDDKIDSKKIAHHLSRHSLTGIFIPSKEQEQLRELVRMRSNTSKSKRAEMCRIRAYLNRQGIEVPAEIKGSKLWSLKGEAWLLSLSKAHLFLGQILTHYQYLCKKKLAEGKLIRKQVKKSSYASTYLYLKSIVGIGWWTAALLITELGEMTRFKGLDQLSSFCGIVPDISASADTISVKGLTKRANRRVRTALVEAAWISIRYDMGLRSVYDRAISNGKASQKAIIKVAKKLLNRIRAVWIKQEMYEYQQIAA